MMSTGIPKCQGRPRSPTMPSNNASASVASSRSAEREASCEPGTSLVVRGRDPDLSDAVAAYGVTSARGETVMWMTFSPRVHAMRPMASNLSSVHWNAAAWLPDP